MVNTSEAIGRLELGHSSFSLTMLACAALGYAPAGPIALHARSSSLVIPQSLPARVPRVSRMIAAAEGALEVSGTSAVATRRRGLAWLMRMVSRSILIWQSVFVQLIKVALVKRRFATRGETSKTAF